MPTPYPSPVVLCDGSGLEPGPDKAACLGCPACTDCTD